MKYTKEDIKVIYPDYTGGGIYVFLGQLSDGNYFMAGNSDWAVRILDACPWRTKNNNWEYADWQEKHLVRDLSDTEAEEFAKGMLEYCIQAKLGYTDDFERFLAKLNREED